MNYYSKKYVKLKNKINISTYIYMIKMQKKSIE